MARAQREQSRAESYAILERITNKKSIHELTEAQIYDIGILDLWPIDTGKDKNVKIGQNFGGAIDDIRKYDRALSKEEMKLHGDPPKPRD